MSGRHGIGQIGLVAAILALAFGLNVYHIGFPLGYHADEAKKAGFILSYRQDFRHPILLLQLARLANLPLGLTDAQQVAVLGRMVSAVAGVAIVLCSYLLAGRLMGGAWPLLAALSVAVSPILVIHAHYLKEDVLYSACALASILTLARLHAAPSGRNVALFGVATGLAMATHYKSALLVASYFALPLFATEARNRRYATSLVLGLGLAVYVFLLVNYPLLEKPRIFLTGLEYESAHVVPGMTAPAAALGLAGLAWAIVRWGRLSWLGRLLVIVIALNYLVPEISPLKPEPDYARYILPVVPLLLIFACWGLSVLARSVGSGLSRRSAALPAALLVLVPLGETIALDHFLGNDTREKVTRWLAAAAGGEVIRESYTGIDFDVASLAELDLEATRRSGVAFLVASSFTYERYYVGGRLPGQDPAVYERHAQYERIFRHPFVEIRPAYKSFAFSNPTIRIIDLRATAGGE